MFSTGTSDFYSASKRLVTMTIQNSSVASQAGNPRNSLRWDLSPDEIRTMASSLISRVEKVYDDIGSISIEEVSVENTLRALATAKLDYAGESGSGYIPTYFLVTCITIIIWTLAER